MARWGVRTLCLVGLSPDGSRLVLGDGDERYDLIVDDALVDQVKAARAAAAVVPDVVPVSGAPTPRQVQERIRRGESAADIARTSGVPLEAVARYEGPVLAERAHHARLARRAAVGGRSVEELLEEHMQRMAQVGLPLAWDSWLTDTGRWEVLVRCGRVLVRLTWDPVARRVNAVDETGRRALGLLPAEQDTLSAVLRPVASRTMQAAVVRAQSAQLSMNVASPDFLSETSRAALASASGADVTALSLAAPAAGESAREPARPQPGGASAGAVPTPAARRVVGARPHDDDPAVDHAVAADVDPAANVPDASEEAEPAPAPPVLRPPTSSPRPGGGRPKRASVPAWDDISGGLSSRPDPRRRS